MKPLLLAVLALAWLVISSNTSYACTCGEHGKPVCAAYWDADAVFVGQLRDITTKNKSDDSFPSVALHFTVEQAFRGVTIGAIEVETGTGTSCSMKFLKGERYLVYAFGNANNLSTGYCTRTTLFENADEDLDYIRALMQKGVTESLSGRVLRSMYEPLPGLKVEVRNGRKRFETVTGNDGEFSVSLAGPGTYTVSVSVPDSVTAFSMIKDIPFKLKQSDTSTTIEYEVKLGKSECDYRELQTWHVDLHASAELSGRVTTDIGSAVHKGQVCLIETGDSSTYKETSTEKDGSFKFKDVAAGEYFLVLNPRNKAPYDDEAPYPRSFYPTGSDKSSASKIVVTEGTKIENLILVAGPAWKARNISGKVVWKDGSPVTDAYVTLIQETTSSQRKKVEPDGSFTFRIYGDFTYFLRAAVITGTPIESRMVEITEDSTNIIIELQRNP